jgi:hypothetical protein
MGGSTVAPSAPFVADLKGALWASRPRILFTAWLSLVGIIVLVWLAQPRANDRTVALSTILCGLSTVGLWCSRGRLARALAGWGASPRVKFVLVGSLGAAWVETVFWALEKVFHAKGVAASPNLAIDLLVTMPWYVMMVALLYRVEATYRYSMYEVLLLGGVYELGADGLVGPFVGGKFSIVSLPIVLLLVPMFVVVYSFMVLPPSVLLREDLGRLREGKAPGPVPASRRYAYALLPLLGLVPYIVLGLITALS